MKIKTKCEIGDSLFVLKGGFEKYIKGKIEKILVHKPVGFTLDGKEPGIGVAYEVAYEEKDQYGNWKQTIEEMFINEKGIFDNGNEKVTVGDCILITFADEDDCRKFIKGKLYANVLIKEYKMRILQEKNGIINIKNRIEHYEEVIKNLKEGVK